MLNDLISEEDKKIETEQEPNKLDDDNKQVFELYMTQYGEMITPVLAKKICSFLNKSFRKAMDFHRNPGIFTDRLLGEFIYENYIEEAEKEFGLDFARDSKHAMDDFCKRFDQECSLNDLKSLLNAFFIWRYRIKKILISNLNLKSFNRYALFCKYFWPDPLLLR